MIYQWLSCSVPVFCSGGVSTYADAHMRALCARKMQNIEQTRYSRSISYIYTVLSIEHLEQAIINLAYLSKMSLSLAVMSFDRFTIANKIGAGYIRFASARVSRPGLRAGWPEKMGEAVPARSIEVTFQVLDSVRSASIEASQRLTHFCGFQRVGGAIVGLVELVQISQSRRIASFAGACRLMGNLQRSGHVCAAGGVGASMDRADQARGSTPSARARCLDGLSLSCDLEFSKKFTPAQRLCHFRGIMLWLLQRHLAEMREVRSAGMGSGVRVARESAVTGRLARRPTSFRQLEVISIGVRVQRAISLAIGVTGAGKLFPQFANVN